MATRTSIELQGDTCRVAEVYLPGRLSAASDGVRIKTFALDLPGSNDPQALQAALTALRKTRRLSRDSCVTLWGAPAIHRVLSLRTGPRSDVKARALAEIADDLASFDAPGEPAVVAVSLGPVAAIGSGSRRPVSVIAASARDVRDGVAPVLAAGFRVSRIVTPALALEAVVRLHGGDSRAAVCAVALGNRATCVTVVSGGVLLLAHELPWGHLDAQAGDFEIRLTTELDRWIRFFAHHAHGPVEHVLVCGGVPRLRALTGPLGDTLGVPVQTLDSLAGVDPGRVPHPGDVFRREVAALRLAIASAAADTTAALRPRHARLMRGARVGLAGAAAAVVALLLAGFLLRPGSTAAPPSAANLRAVSPIVDRPPVSPPTLPAETLSAVPTTPEPSQSVRPGPRPSTPAALTSVPAEASEIEEVTVTSILYSAERQLAIVNGRIVRNGDRVGSSTVYQIQPRSVVLEAADGRRWTSALRTVVDAP